MTTYVSPAQPWRVIGRSVRGASHVREGGGNQDAIKWLPPGGAGIRVVLSVSDGHGSPKSFRSATGARFAIDVSHYYASELLAMTSSRELSFVKDRLELDIPKRIVRDWRTRVEADLSRLPFSEHELAQVVELDGIKGRQLVELDPHLAYGSTLVTAVATEAFTAFWQIGDGDALTVSAVGEVGRALGQDNLMIGNETASLCSADAWSLFRAAVFGTPAPIILVSTDGFSNSFQDDQGFFKFGSDVLGLVITEGIEAVNDRLDEWLREMTVAGSGDDISLGIICRPDALPTSLPSSMKPFLKSLDDAGSQDS